MVREENIRVFNETKSMCKCHPKLMKSIAFSCEWQRAVLERDKIIVKSRLLYEEPAQIIVSDKRSMEAALAYRGQKICVLNMASAVNPGGSVAKGGSAQEESLCRVSTLYFCINTEEMQQAFYHPHKTKPNPASSDDLIYTSKVTVFKTDTDVPQLLPEEEWYQVNVITCASPDLRMDLEKSAISMHRFDMYGEDGVYENVFLNRYTGDMQIEPKIADRELLFLYEKRFRRILDAALRTKNEVVILGAFGCDVYENDPRIVAQAAKNILPEYRYAFKTIEFAVHYDSKNMLNYTIFKKAFQNM